MNNSPTPAELVERHDVAALAATTHRLAIRLTYARHGALPLDDDERADSALLCLAHAHATADAALADRWRWAVEALTAGASLPDVARACALDLDEIEVGIRSWLEQAHRGSALTDDHLAHALAALDARRPTTGGVGDDR